MKRLQAYKFELRPNGQQKRDLRRFAGSCRYVFNKALVLQQARYEHGEKKLGYAGLCTLLTQWKGQPETAWLTETPSQALQQSLKDLERAYKHFFEQRTDFPRFKKKGHSDRFRYPQGYRLDQSHSRIFLPKLGWLRYRNSRDVLGTVKNVTVSQSNGTWFVSIQTERAVEQPVHPATSIIGIDMGIARFATLSDGTFIVPLNKVKFSHNWKKAKACVQKIHARIGNARRDFLHKTTTTISKNHAIVCLEDLQVRNMSTSAAGTVETPGRNVRAKSGLNTSTLDQGWGEFRRQLDYKLSWTGGHLIAVPPHHTSQTCPACGHMSADNRQTQARFACVECGYENHADLVGALNIVAAGHAVLACGGTALSGRPMKQEPAEATRAAHAA